MKTVIIAQYQDGLQVNQLVFYVEHSYATEDELMDAIRHTVRDWGQTQAGNEAWKDASEDFNWGDLALYLEHVPWPKAIKSIETDEPTTSAVRVEHDELLMPWANDDEQEEIE